jgi:hypothetical protein
MSEPHYPDNYPRIKREFIFQPFFNDTNNRHPILTFLSVLFNSTNFYIVLWFLAIYTVAYFFTYISSEKKNYTNSQFSTRLSRIIDFVFFFFFLFFLLSFFYQSASPIPDINKFLVNICDSIFHYAENPVSIFTTIVLLIVFYSVLIVSEVPIFINESLMIMVIETFFWLYLVIGILFYMKNMYSASLNTPTMANQVLLQQCS